MTNANEKYSVYIKSENLISDNGISIYDKVQHYLNKSRNSPTRIAKLEALKKAKEYVKTGPKILNDEINEELLADIKSGTSMEDLNTNYSIEVVKAMQDTINSLTIMSHDSVFMSRFREKLPTELQTVFYDGDSPREELHFETYAQMKKLTDYCKTFSADVTRTNEELKLQIEQREFDLESERNSTSRRYEANSKNPINSGYVGGSSGK